MAEEMYNFATVLPDQMINLDFDPKFKLPKEQLEILLNGCKIRFIDSEDSVLVATEYLNKDLFEQALMDDANAQLMQVGVVKIDYDTMITGMLLTYESAKKKNTITYYGLMVYLTIIQSTNNC